jgi:hypothetical protein
MYSCLLPLSSVGLMGVPKYGVNICFIGQKGRIPNINTCAGAAAYSYNVCYCPCTVHLSAQLSYLLLSLLQLSTLSVMLFRFFVDCSCVIRPCYPCVHLPVLSCAFYLCYPPLQLSTLCAINLCYSSLQLSTLCYQTLLSPFTTVYLVLSVSAIPLSIVYHMLSVSAIHLYYCLPCAFYLCHLPCTSNCLPCPTCSLCYPPLQLSTLCYQTRLSLFTTVNPVLPDSAIPLYNSLPCASRLSLSPLQLSTCVISLCYTHLQVSILCCQTLIPPVLPVSAIPPTVYPALPVSAIAMEKRI